ncbi:MAG: hypothetical protein R3C01_05375 [Planctomycetaceae bacterium]
MISAPPTVAHRQPNSPHVVTVRPARRGFDLLRNCPLLADGFDDLDDLIADYVDATSNKAPSDERTDAACFMDWMDDRLFLTPEEQDFVTSQRSRHTVELLAVQQRVAHLRFQHLLALRENALPAEPLSSRITVVINPVRVWSKFQTRALVDESTPIPATVLFVAHGTQVSQVVVTPLGESLLRLLETSGPLTISQLQRLRPQTPPNQIIQELHRLTIQKALALRS